MATRETASELRHEPVMHRATRDEDDRAGLHLPPPDWPHRALSQRQVAGKVRWHLQRGGDGIRTLLLHGTGSSTHSWAGLVPRLLPRHEILAPDLPGHGFSGPMGGEAGAAAPTLPAMAEALQALLEAQEFTPELIIGHSAGAALALWLALETAHPPPLVIGINAALAPYDGLLAPIAQPLAKLFASQQLVSRFLAGRARQAGTVERLISGTGSRLAPEGIDAYRQLLSREGHVRATLDMMANWDLHALEHRLPDLPSALCLVVGENDQTVPPTQAVPALDTVPRGRLLRLHGLGHLAHEEQPGVVYDAILDALRWGAPDLAPHHHTGVDT